MTLRAGEHAVVIGASGGIGGAIALALSQEGLHLTLVGRNEEKLNQVAAQAKSPTRILLADIGAADGVTAIAQAMPPVLHVMVHSAGVFWRGGAGGISPAEWAALNAVNLSGPILLTAACLPQLKAGSGQVAFINSTAGLRAGPGVAAYAASKQALKAATDSLRDEINADGIRVISIFPGRTRTAMQDSVLAQEGRTAGPDTLMEPGDVASMLLAALRLPRTAEVTDIVMRPRRPL